MEEQETPNHMAAILSYLHESHMEQINQIQKDNKHAIDANQQCTRQVIKSTTLVLELLASQQIY